MRLRVGSPSISCLHVDKIGYQAMVIPVICMAFMLVTIEKWLHKRLSGTADFLLTPLITILLTDGVLVEHYVDRTNSASLINNIVVAGNHQGGIISAILFLMDG